MLGIPIKEIVRRTGHSRKLVRQVIRGQRTDIFRVRQSSLEARHPFLDGQWEHLRGLLMDGALSASTDPIDGRYFEKLRSMPAEVGTEGAALRVMIKRGL